MSLQVNDLVEFIEPMEDEAGTTYRLVELNGDRCVIELVCDMRIRPTWVRLVADLKRVDAGGTGKPARYVLAADDGRMVTNDTRTGPSLTTSQALSYVWTNPTEADSQRLAYQATLGVALKVQLQGVKT